MNDSEVLCMIRNILEASQPVTAETSECSRSQECDRTQMTPKTFFLRLMKAQKPDFGCFTDHAENDTVFNNILALTKAKLRKNVRDEFSRVLMLVQKSKEDGNCHIAVLLKRTASECAQRHIDEFSFSSKMDKIECDLV
ncbi:Hypothetical_protein [Hexamita inflata]|uniref:Hypothetical_protein n=1 Tax=Hexamita inflata TaxID=28002 RepID=A0AA86QE71_9EUKA|nr:Hypothetical protein HINF_LOCUS39127 [Hexamita inflata]CAI9951485.1 Hypothetical protein HINF_LOCUS39130 [Hexamita inflata]